MLYFIVFLLVFLSIFKFINKIKSCHDYYTKYKNFIDPENKHSHFYTIKSMFMILYSIYQSTKVSQPQPTQTQEPEKFNKKYIKISYKYKDKNYFYLLKVPRGLNPIKQITDENDNDIHDNIYPYLGPSLDCHGTTLCPKDFGYEKIKITTIFDKLIVFEENQKIDLIE